MAELVFSMAAENLSAGRMQATLEDLDESYSYSGRKVIWRCRNVTSNGSWTDKATKSLAAGATEMDYVYTGLVEGAEYEIEVEVTNIKTDSGEISVTISCDETYCAATQCKSLKVSNMSYSKGTAKITWSCSCSSSTFKYFLYDLQDSNNKSVANGSLTAKNVTLDVEQDEDYTFYIRPVTELEDGSEVWHKLSSLDFTVEPPPTWEWDEDEMEAFANGGNFSVLSVNRWNAFLDWCNEHLDSKGGTKIDKEYYGKSGEPFFASDFNEITYCINTIVDVPQEILATKKRGDAIKGQYFIDLAEAMNDGL